MAYRGHDEDSESLNQGKWEEFIKLMLLTNKHFKDLHSSIIATHKTYGYTFNRSCNEMIQALADEVRHTIRSEIEASKMFALLIDECKDNAGHEELSICFRYLDKNMVIMERFYSLTRLVETDADGILQKGVIPTLNEMGLTSKLLALGADGAAVMSGQHSGVIAKIQEIYPEMIYIHCAAQRLNLVVAAYFKQVKSASSVINIYKSLQNIFNVHQKINSSSKKYRKDYILTKK